MSRHNCDVVSGYEYRTVAESRDRAWKASHSYREAYLGLRKELRDYIKSGGQLPDHLVKLSGMRKVK